MKGFRKRTNLISLWEEDGDLEQMRTYFKTMTAASKTNAETKQSIKQKALDKIVSEQWGEVPMTGKERVINRLRTKLSTFGGARRWKLGLAVTGLIFLIIVGQGTMNSARHLLPQMGSLASKSQMPQMMAGSSTSLAVEDRASQSTASSESTANPSVKMAPIAPPTPVPNEAAPADASTPRKITQDVSLTLEVTNLSNSFNQISQAVQQMGGYVAESQQNGSENQASAHMTVKVPADKLNGLKDSLSTLGKIVDQHTVANDITNQYYDSQGRLQTLEAEEKRYLEILNQAKTVDDVLKVENALGNIRQQIEQLKGQLKLWNNQVDYSTVNLQLVTYSSPSIEISNPWQPVSWRNTWKAAQNAFLKTISSAWNALNYLVVGLGYVFPYLFLGFLGWVIYRIWSKKR